MRYVIFLTFFFFSLYAKSEDTCYSVSLLSVPDTKQNAQALLKNKYPLSSCKIMSISNILTVRCGCFEKISQARKAAEFIAKRYKHPLQIVSTYKYRFAQAAEKTDALVKLVKPIKVIKKIKIETKTERKIERKELKKQPKEVLKPFVKEFVRADVEPTEVEPELQGHIDLTLLGRYLSNKDFYKNSPYYFALAASDYQGDDFSIYGGVGLQSREGKEEFFINHIYGEYFGDDYTFKIGKMVQKIGVMDYFSVLDTLNPPREAFFDDAQLEIKKIPLWMSSIDYFVNDSVKLTAFIQPYDMRHQNYTGPYIDYLLRQFIPEYYKDFFAQEPLGQELFYPLYRDSFVPYVKNEVQDKAASEQIYWDKLSYAFVSEYSDDNKKIGLLYFNRYSELPMIKIDQNLLDAALAYENEEDPSAELVEYIESGDYDLIKSVKEFRYQQFGLYGETTLHSFGLRAELGYRDKVPVFNAYSGLTTVGAAVDYLSSSVYNALEMQYIYLEKYQKNAYIAMWRTRFSKQMLWRFSWYFENSFIATQADKFDEYSIVPNLTMSYKQTDLSLQGIVSKNNTKTNTVSILLRGRF